MIGAIELGVLMEKEGDCLNCIKRMFVLSAIFWILTSCIHVDRHRHFDGT